MLRIVLGQGTNPDRLAEFLSGLLGERFRWSSEANLPRFVTERGAWSLDAAESFWLRHETGSVYSVESTDESRRQEITGLLDEVRKHPLVMAVKIVK